MDHKLRLALGAVAFTARQRAGLTQAEVAKRIGIAQGVYGRIERGQMMPSVSTLRRLCTLLNVPSDTLLGFSGTAPRGDVAPSPMEEEAPELRHLARTLRTLPAPALKALNVLASALAR